MLKEDCETTEINIAEQCIIFCWQDESGKTGIYREEYSAIRDAIKTAKSWYCIWASIYHRGSLFCYEGGSRKYG